MNIDRGIDMEHLLSKGPLLDKKGNLIEAGYSFELVKEYSRKAIKGLKQFIGHLVRQEQCLVPCLFVAHCLARCCYRQHGYQGHHYLLHIRLVLIVQHSVSFFIGKSTKKIMHQKRISPKLVGGNPYCYNNAVCGYLFLQGLEQMIEGGVGIAFGFVEQGNELRTDDSSCGIVLGCIKRLLIADAETNHAGIA